MRLTRWPIPPRGSTRRRWAWRTSPVRRLSGGLDRLRLQVVAKVPDSPEVRFAEPPWTTYFTVGNIKKHYGACTMPGSAVSPVPGGRPCWPDSCRTGSTGTRPCYFAGCEAPIVMGTPTSANRTPPVRPVTPTTAAGATPASRRRRKGQCRPMPRWPAARRPCAPLLRDDPEYRGKGDPLNAAHRSSARQPAHGDKMAEPGRPELIAENMVSATWRPVCARLAARPGLSTPSPKG